MVEKTQSLHQLPLFLEILIFKTKDTVFRKFQRSHVIVDSMLMLV